jgi:acetoin utilization deacetylase AcuC-like enzyme
MSTALIYTDDYLKHNTGEHPERRERYSAALGGLTLDRDFWEDLVKLAPREATDEELMRCHTADSVARVERACEAAPAALDADTVVSNESRAGRASRWTR